MMKAMVMMMLMVLMVWCVDAVGGDLDFNGVANTATSKNDHFSCSHLPGVAVLHLGSHWHSALKITECVDASSFFAPPTTVLTLTLTSPLLDRGERWNLIMWCRSSERRGRGNK
jgi:hypothetical protein